MERRGCRAPCCKEMAKCQETYPAAPQEEPPGGFAPEADGLGRSRGGLQSSSRSRTTCLPGVSVATSAARWSSTASGPPPDTTCSATGSPSSSLRGLVPLRGRLLPRQSAERGIHTGPSPVDRGRAGSKHHLITDGHGTPLAVLLTGGNRNDVTQLLPLLDAIPPVRGRIGRPRRKRDSLCADRGYDHDIYRDQVRARGIVPVIAPPRHPARHRTGHLPLGGRAKSCVAARLPTSAHPMGTASRHPRSVPQTRPLPHHLPTTRLIESAVVRLRQMACRGGVSSCLGSFFCFPLMIALSF